MKYPSTSEWIELQKRCEALGADVSGVEARADPAPWLLNSAKVLRTTGGALVLLVRLEPGVWAALALLPFERFEQLLGAEQMSSQRILDRTNVL